MSEGEKTKDLPKRDIDIYWTSKKITKEDDWDKLWDHESLGPLPKTDTEYELDNDISDYLTNNPIEKKNEKKNEEVTTQTDSNEEKGGKKATRRKLCLSQFAFHDLDDASDTFSLRISILRAYFKVPGLEENFEKVLPEQLIKCKNNYLNYRKEFGSEVTDEGLCHSCKKTKIELNPEERAELQAYLRKHSVRLPGEIFVGVKATYLSGKKGFSAQLPPEEPWPEKEVELNVSSPSNTDYAHLDSRIKQGIFIKKDELVTPESKFGMTIFPFSYRFNFSNIPLEEIKDDTDPQIDLEFFSIHENNPFVLSDQLCHCCNCSSNFNCCTCCCRCCICCECCIPEGTEQSPTLCKASIKTNILLDYLKQFKESGIEHLEKEAILRIKKKSEGEDDTDGGWVAVVLSLSRTKLTKFNWNTYPYIGPKSDRNNLDEMDTIEEILQRWRYPIDIHYEVEKYLLNSCPAEIWPDVFKCIIKYSPDPIRSSMNAYNICNERNNPSEGWESHKVLASEHTQKYSDIIPLLLKRSQATELYRQVANMIVDENIDYAIDSDNKAAMANGAMIDRIDQRWEDKSIHILPNLKISPLVSFSFQVFFFVIFLCLSTYSVSSGFAVHHIDWTSNLASDFFGCAFDGSCDTCSTASGISDADSFWSWMEDQFLKTAMFIETGSPSEADLSLWLSTPVYMRQWRVDTYDCYFSRYNFTCWEEMPINPNSVRFDDSQHAGTEWNNDVGLALLGRVVRYPSGGYLAVLDRNYTSANETVQALKDEGWIDDGTRGVIIEFAVYNPNADLFAIVESMVEYTHVGGVVANSEITVLFDSVHNSSKNWIFIFICLYIAGYFLQEVFEKLVDFYLSVMEFKKDLKYKGKSDISNCEKIYEYLCLMLSEFKLTQGSLWNLMDYTVIFGVGVYCITFIVTDNLYPTDAVNVDLNDLYEIQKWYNLGLICGSVGMAVAWIRLLYFLIPSKVLGPLVVGLLFMGKDVLHFMVLGGTTLMGFGSAFNMVYGPQIEEFTGIRMSWYTSLLIAETEFDFQDVVPFLPWPFEISLFGNFLMLAYVLLEVIILINLLVAMMGTTYDKVSEEKEQQFHLSRGDVLSHYETYAFLPPPLNMVQALLYFIFLVWSWILGRNMEWGLLGRQAEKQKALIYKLIRDDKNSEKTEHDECSCDCSCDCSKKRVKKFFNQLFGRIKTFFSELWDSIFDNLGVSKERMEKKSYRQTILRYRNAICFHIKLHNNDLEIEKEVKERAVPKDWKIHEESDNTKYTDEKVKDKEVDIRQSQGQSKKALERSGKTRTKSRGKSRGKSITKPRRTTKTTTKDEEVSYVKLETI